MRLIISLIAAVIIIIVGSALAAPQLLENLPIESPEESYAANVQWDDAGFIGRIKMLIYKTGSTPVKSVELPQMKPAPANLTWLSEVWVACESFVAEMGAAFFYMDVEREKGYLLEVLAPENDGDWIITYNTNDSVSSDTINTLGRGRSSLFPILLRNLPEEGNYYLTADFAYLLADAVDSYSQWRKKEKFTDLKFLSDIAVNESTGHLVIAKVDDSTELIYFPQRTTTTREMLALTRRQKMPESVQSLLNGLNPPELKVEWLGSEGEFHVIGIASDGATSSTELVRGKLEGIIDTFYTGPGVAELLKESKAATKTSSSNNKESETRKSPSKPSKSSSKSSSQSGNSKKPSRSN